MRALNLHHFSPEYGSHEATAPRFEQRGQGDGIPRLFADMAITLTTLQDHPPFPPTDEDAPTLEGNAVKKAMEAFAKTRHPVGGGRYRSRSVLSGRPARRLFVPLRRSGCDVRRQLQETRWMTCGVLLRADVARSSGACWHSCPDGTHRALCRGGLPRCHHRTSHPATGDSGTIRSSCLTATRRPSAR